MLNFVKELSKIPGSSAEVAFASIEEGYTFGVWVLFLALVKRAVVNHCLHPLKRNIQLVNRVVVAAVWQL